MRAKSIALVSVIALLVLGCSTPATVFPMPTESPAPTIEPSYTHEPTATEVVSTPTLFPTQTLTPEPSLQTDGPYFMYFRQVDWKYQLVMMDADGEGRKNISLPPEIAEILPIERFHPDMKFVSPDGKWLAYSSDESGRNEVYIDSFPEPRNKYKVTDHGGIPVSWRQDGRELLFIGADFRSVNVVDVTTGASVAAQVPRKLFDFPKSAVLYRYGRLSSRR